MNNKSTMTSLEMDVEMRRRIDDLRLARARASEGVPPSMRAIITEALSEFLERELRRFTR
jgi:predicted transcriptional regulator